MISQTGDCFYIIPHTLGRKQFFIKLSFLPHFHQTHTNEKIMNAFPPTILSLPEELLQRVLSFLSFYEIIQHAHPVCRRFHRSAQKVCAHRIRSRAWDQVMFTGEKRPKTPGDNFSEKPLTLDVNLTGEGEGWGVEANNFFIPFPPTEGVNVPREKRLGRMKRCYNRHVSRKLNERIVNQLQGVMGTLRIRKELDEKGEQMAPLEFVKARLFPNLINIALKDVTLPTGGLAGLGELCEKELLYRVILENVKPEREDWSAFRKEVLVLVKSSRHGHGELTIVNCPDFRPPLEFLSSLLTERKEKMWSFSSDYQPLMKEIAEEMTFFEFLNSWLTNAVENCGKEPWGHCEKDPWGRYLQLGLAVKTPGVGSRIYPPQNDSVRVTGAYCHYTVYQDLGAASFLLTCGIDIKIKNEEQERPSLQRLRAFLLDNFLLSVRRTYEKVTGKKLSNTLEWDERGSSLHITLHDMYASI